MESDAPASSDFPTCPKTYVEIQDLLKMWRPVKIMVPATANSSLILLAPEIFHNKQLDYALATIPSTVLQLKILKNMKSYDQHRWKHGEQ